MVKKIDEINAMLKEKVWPEAGGDVKEGSEWLVGQEKGLDFRKGTLWYGGGEPIMLGKGF